MALQWPEKRYWRMVGAADDQRDFALSKSDKHVVRIGKAMCVADDGRDVVQRNASQLMFMVADQEKAALYRETAAILSNLDDATEHRRKSRLEAGVEDEAQFCNEDSAGFSLKKAAT